MANIQKAGGDVDGAYRTIEACQTKLKALGEIAACKVAEAFKAQLDLEFNLMDSVSCWEKNVQISPFDGIVSLHPIYLYCTLARVLTATGRWAFAHLLLSKIKKLLESFPIPNYNIFAHFLDAHLAFRMNKKPETRPALLQLLHIGYTNGYVRFFADNGHDMKDLLKFGIDEKVYDMPDGVPLEYMQRLLALTDEYIKNTRKYRKPVQTADATGITPREREIIEGMAQNLTNQEIADRLYVSLQTVKNHASSIYRKLNVESRMQAVSAARAAGLISF